MSELRFTIITVCFNAEKHIADTMESVLKQKFDKYEYIIKDGGSTDNTLEIVNCIANGNKKINIISDQDCGIYDAMNSAVNLAKGDYIYFLNAGDIFYNAEILGKVDDFINVRKADIVYGNIVQVENNKKNIRRYGKIYRKKIIYSVGDCICHQALFGKRELFSCKKFNLKYKVCADREWQLFWLCKGVVFLPMFFEVSEVLVDGFSKKHVNEFNEEVEKCIQIYCSELAWIYNVITVLKNNALTLAVLRIIEKILWTDKQRLF